MEKENKKETTTTESTLIGAKFKNGKKIGELIHDGVTKTLKLEDGEEITVSPAEFKKWKVMELPEKEVEVTPNTDEVVESPVEEPKKDAKPKEKKVRVKATKTTSKAVVTDKPKGNITWDEFYTYMCAHCDDKVVISGIIVVSNDNFTEEYSLESRSYRVFTTAKAFHSGKISNELTGSAIDGSDPGVRLDYYNWKIDYCYVE